MTTDITPAPLADVIQWAKTQTYSSFCLSIASYFDRTGQLTPKQDEAIRRQYNRALQPAKAPVANPVTEVGMYRKGDDIYRVKLSKAGRLYAMRFNPNGDTPGARFDYVGGAIYSLEASHRMSVEDVSALGLKFGICVVCGAELTDTKSVARGIGPVCAKRV